MQRFVRSLCCYAARLIQAFHELPNHPGYTDSILRTNLTQHAQRFKFSEIKLAQVSQQHELHSLRVVEERASSIRNVIWWTRWMQLRRIKHDIWNWFMRKRPVSNLLTGKCYLTPWKCTQFSTELHNEYRNNLGIIACNFPELQPLR
jgi:hypothetical protein